MDYLQAREYVNKTLNKGSILGLESIKRLMEKLSNVQNELKIIQVAGTNGKGSSAVYLSEILMDKGYKVGRYMSPAVFDYREIFTINGEMIKEEDYGEIVSVIAQKISEIESEGYEGPTSFEIETGIAFLYFYREKCDVVIMETGMGGDMDATNVNDFAILSILTPVGLDHMDFLGNTITEIAGHKAGIIKPNSKVVVANQTSQAIKVFEAKAKEMGCEITITKSPLNIRFENDMTIFDYVTNDGECFENLKTRMLGSFQPYNAINAVEGINLLNKVGFNIEKENVYRGIEKAFLKGRFECLKTDFADIYFDGGHNPLAAEEIEKTMDLYFTNKSLIYIIGMLADKDCDGVMKKICGFADYIVTVTPDNKRALSAEKLKAIARKYNENVSAAKDFCEAFSMVKEYIEEKKSNNKEIDTKKNKPVIFIGGSLSYLNSIREEIYANRK